MGTKVWIGGSGTQSWTSTTNWLGGVIPVTGDDVTVNYGNADIQTGLSQSAVTLANLNFGPNFSGTVGSADAIPVPLAIGVSGSVTINTASSNIGLDLGATTPKITVLSTGQPASTSIGAESFRVRGGAAGATIAVTGQTSSVGIATDYLGLTATMEWRIGNGTLNVGAGVTWTNGYQSGNGANPGGTVTTLGGGTLIQQSGSNGQLVTFGTAKITTLTISSNAILGHRPAAGTDAWATLTIGPNASVDCSQNPADFTITNPISMATGATFGTFNAAQCQVHGGGAYEIDFQGCQPSDVTLNTGTPCVLTVAA